MVRWSMVLSGVVAVDEYRSDVKITDALTTHDSGRYNYQYRDKRSTVHTRNKSVLSNRRTENVIYYL